MAEYLIDGQRLTLIADGIRTLSGTNSNLTIVDMITNLSSMDSNMGVQEDLIDEGLSILEDKKITAIAFIIEVSSEISLACAAETGMTWGEWVDSYYNTKGYHFINDTLYTSTEANYILSVSPSQEIIHGSTYVQSQGGSGGSSD